MVGEMWIEITSSEAIRLASKPAPDLLRLALLIFAPPSKSAQTAVAKDNYGAIPLVSEVTGVSD